MYASRPQDDSSPEASLGIPVTAARGPFQILALVGDNGVDECVVGDGGSARVCDVCIAPSG